MRLPSILFSAIRYVFAPRQGPQQRTYIGCEPNHVIDRFYR